jgi:hypothetical protein
MLFEPQAYPWMEAFGNKEPPGEAHQDQARAMYMGGAHQTWCG